MAINRVDYGGSTLIDISDTTAAAADVASGKYFYTNAGVKTLGTASGGGGGGGGGASNLVTGTFTGTTTGAAMDVPLNYTGSGYPIVLVIYPTGGAYNNTAPSGSNAYNWYNLVQRYAVAFFSAVKNVPDQIPFQGITNKATTANVYKNSTSAANTYQRTSTMDVDTFGGSTLSAVSSNTKCAVFKSATTMSVFIASTSYGFAANIEYTYHIIYSS